MTVPDETDEIVVVGGGAAALCAALAAREHGARVRLLERAPRALRGGNTRHSRNFRALHATPTAYAPGIYQHAELLAELQRATNGDCDSALATRLADGLDGIVDWLRAQGVALQPHGLAVLPPSRRTVFLHGGGTALVNALYARAEQLGVRIDYEHEVSGLKLSAGRLAALHAHRGERHEILHPAATVLCCGGAQANPDWLARYWGNAARGFINRGTPFADGRLLDVLLAQGALAVGDGRSAHLVAVDARSPADGGIVTRIRGMPEGIVVDISARRFHDEGQDTASTRYSVWGRLLAGVAQQTAWLILDARGLHAAPPALLAPITAPDPIALARTLGLPPQVLAATVADYNAAIMPPTDRQNSACWATRGLDPEKSHHARPLVKPPFAAYPMRPGITFTGLGVAVDETLRIRHAGGAYANLFAAGMLMAPNLIPHGYVSGLALALGMVFGRRAGEEAARLVR